LREKEGNGNRGGGKYDMRGFGWTLPGIRPGNVILKIFWVTKKIHFKESIEKGGKNLDQPAYLD
jgi:hypothetical protein